MLSQLINVMSFMAIDLLFYGLLIDIIVSAYSVIYTWMWI